MTCEHGYTSGWDCPECDCPICGTPESTCPPGCPKHEDNTRDCPGAV